MALYFDISEMNQPLKAISVIKKNPQREQLWLVYLQCVSVAVSFRLLGLIGVTS